MARQRRQSRAELLREACNEAYEGFTDDAVKEEIARLNKVNIDLIENKKAEAKSYNDLIKENVDKIEYLIEKLDALRHEDAVQNQLEQAAG